MFLEIEQFCTLVTSSDTLNYENLGGFLTRNEGWKKEQKINKLGAIYEALNSISHKNSQFVWAYLTHTGRSCNFRR